jgi:hypothetical protein
MFHRTEKRMQGNVLQNVRRREVELRSERQLHLEGHLPRQGQLLGQKTELSGTFPAAEQAPFFKTERVKHLPTSTRMA